MKKKALVVCPGRGTYNKDELGYLKRYHGGKTEFIESLDACRTAQEQEPVSVLDARESFSLQDFSRGDNASPLIYACAYADFLSIDRERYDIAAVTGNSMGWYIALACAGALSSEGGMDVINTMGTLMHAHQVGGQVIYPFVDEHWQEISGRRDALLSLVEEIDDLYVSIELGGMIVLAGSDGALEALMGKLEPQGRFPLRLAGHGAFHTPLVAHVAEKGQAALGRNLFNKPFVPLVDGRGFIWSPYSTDPQDLRSYTLDYQVCKTYDFSRAMQVGLKEFAPDCLIVLGPGNTLGGAVAQSSCLMRWKGMHKKEAFLAQQEGEPFMFSMGLEEQRRKVVSSAQ